MLYTLEDQDRKTATDAFRFAHHVLRRSLLRMAPQRRGRAMTLSMISGCSVTFSPFSVLPVERSCVCDVSVAEYEREMQRNL